MTFRFHVEAAAEYENQIRYYRRCQPGLQHRFTAAVEEALAIRDEPEARRQLGQCRQGAETIPEWSRAN